MLRKTFLLLAYLCFLTSGSVSFKGSHQTTHNVTRRNSKRSDDRSTKQLVSNPADIKVVVCAILKNEDNYVDEWIHYNMYLGVNHMHLYDNSHNGSSKLASLPHTYGDFVSVVHMPGLSKQKPAYADCGHRYAAHNFWAAFIDCDEFIVLRKHKSVQELLHSLVPHGGGLSLFSVIFGSNHHTHYENKPVLSRFTMRRKATDVYTKVIAYLPDIVHYDVHSVRVRNGTHVLDCHGNKVTHGKLRRPREAHEDVAALYHFKIKSFQEFRQKRLRGSANYHRHGEKYHRPDANHTLKHEFMRNDKTSYAVNDTAALDFFERRKKEVIGFPHI